MNGKLLKLSALIEQRNLIDEEIGCLIGQPALLGHAGEFIAACVFDIRPGGFNALHGVDGFFASGPLAGKSVSVKWYRDQNGVLDIHPTLLPDYYLVMTGPRRNEGPSCNAHPWLIEMVYLFETTELVRRLKVHKIPVGVATPMPLTWWREAELYPQARSPLLKLSSGQMQLLKLFGQEQKPEPPKSGPTYEPRDLRPYA